MSHSTALALKKWEFGPMFGVPVKRQTGSVPAAALSTDQAWK